MATIEKETYNDQRGDSIENEPIFGVDHDHLFAAVKEGDQIREYRLGAGFDNKDADDLRSRLPAVEGVVVGENTRPLILGSMVEVVGVKAVYDKEWTPASAVYALRRTTHDIQRTRTGKVKKIDVASDAASLSVVAPKNYEEEVERD